MKLVTEQTYKSMSRKACDVITAYIRDADRPVLGLATGSTPEGLYEELIRRCRDGEVSFRAVTTFNLDEYIGLPADDPNSYRHFMQEKLFDAIDVRPEQTHVPDGRARDLEEECAAYEARIREAGGIGIQVLGLGLNGHIGFNEPGTSFGSRTHVVKLADSTRRANARFFEGLEDVPEQAISMGISTIMESRKILLLVSGEKKAAALERLLNGPVSEDFPASILQRHPDVTIIADEAALAGVGMR